MDRIEERLEALGRPPIVSFLAFLFLCCSIGFAWRGGALGDCGTVLDARVVEGYSAAGVHEHFRCLGQDGRALYAFTERTLDVAFPVVYAALTAILLACLGPLRWFRHPWSVPLAAGAVDLIEGVVLSLLATSHVDLVSPSTGIAAVALALTRTKGLLLLAAGVLVLMSWRRNRVHGWPALGFAWLWIASILIPAFGAMGLGLALLPLGVVVHWKWLYVGQYLFFLRYPILVGAVIAVLPQLIQAEGTLLGNLLVLETRAGVLSVSFMATLVTLTVMSITRLVYLTAAQRMELPLVRIRTRETWLGFWTSEKVRPVVDALFPATGARPHRVKRRRSLVDLNRQLLMYLCPWAVRLRAPLFALLAIPMLLGIRRVSAEAQPVLLVAGWALAVVVAFGLQRLERGLRRLMSAWWQGPEGRKSASAPGAEGGSALGNGDRLRTTYGRALRGLDRWFPGFGGNGQAPVALVAVLGLVAYLALSPVLGTERSLSWALRLPPILYVFLIGVVITWVISNVALLFDRARVPVVLLTVLALAAGFRLWGSDRYYMISGNSTALQNLPTPGEVVRARHARSGGDLVTVVAASGGGITASLWTARVLKGLHEDGGDSLAASIVALSTNSGGSVGAMYYTDAFDSTGVSPQRLGSVVEAAGASSLSSVVWGMAYPDLLRILSAGYYPRGNFVARDRGWAMDRRWEALRASLIDPRPEPPPRRLGEWVHGVRAGWRPAHVFNSTVVETGAAMRIATVALSDSEPEPRHQSGSETREFADLYSWADIDVATAARLSATFPWISPMVRPWVDPQTVGQSLGPAGSVPGTRSAALDSVAFHLADGGYFDNFGVSAALDFLRRVTPDTLRQEGVRRMVLIQIRASPEGEGKPGQGGFLYSSLGPVLTQNAVRTSSQIGRNDEEIELLQEAWAAGGVLVCPVEFELPVDGPLSWHLSSAERQALVEAWTGPLIAKARALRAFLSAPPPAGSAWSCPEGLRG